MIRIILLLLFVCGAAHAEVCTAAQTQAQGGDTRCGPYAFTRTNDAGFYGPSNTASTAGNQSNNAFDKCIPIASGSLWTGPWPIIVIIHGGGWTTRNKGDDAYECGSWASNGYAAFSINYRLQKGGSTPSTASSFADVQLAVRYFRTNASGFHGSQNVTSKGDSAGGSLAVQLGFQSSIYGFSGDTAPTLYTTVSPQANQVLDEFGPYTGVPSGPKPQTIVRANSGLNVPVFVVQGYNDGSVNKSESLALVNDLTAAQKIVYYYSYWGNHEYGNIPPLCTSNCDPTKGQTDAAYVKQSTIDGRTAQEMWLGAILKLKGINVSLPATAH